jgi:cbb3-type cytochrome oxidase maturation protein
MSVIAVMIGASLMLAGGFLLAFLWAVRSGQFEDKMTPSIRMLFDDRKPVDRPAGSNHHPS